MPKEIIEVRIEPVELFRAILDAVWPTSILEIETASGGYVRLEDANGEKRVILSEGVTANDAATSILAKF
jgi:hypothetical protein